MAFRKRILLLTALSLLPAAVPAYGRDCVATRIDQPAKPGQPEGSLARVPVMDQDGTGTCWAYTAAQMVDAYRFRQPGADKSHLTSPVAAAVDYAKANGRSDIEEGSLGSAVDLIFQHGSCSFAAVGDRFGAYDLDGFMKGLGAYFDSYKNSGEDKNAAEAVACFLHEKDFLPKNFDAEALLKSLHQENFMDFLYSSVAQLCRSHSLPFRKRPQVQVMQATDFPDPAVRKNKFLEKMDKVSSPTSLPVGVYLCQELALDGEMQGVEPNGEKTGDCTLHTAMVVGRRLNSAGTCQVLLRNSWGSSCNGFAWNCERGQIWVDEDRLLENTLAVVNLE